MNSNTRREDTSIVPPKPDSRRPLNDVSANPTRKRQLDESSHETSSPRKGRLHHQQEVRYLKNTEADPERYLQRCEPRQPSSQRSKWPSSLLSTSRLFVSEVNSTPSANLEVYIQCWLRDIPKSQCERLTGDFSSNKMAHSVSTTSSRKRRRFSNHNDLDMDATLRPQRTLKVPAIEAGGVLASDSSKSRSTTSKRSASPVKRIADMEYFSNPVIMKAFGDPSMDLRSDLGDMLRQVGRFSRGIKVVSRQLQDDIEAMQENSFRFIEEESFGDTLLPSPSTIDVAHLLLHARKCDTKGHSEASWNCFVHSTLLDMALCGTKYPVEFLNCSTSRIQPTGLIPTTTLGQATESKMADFAIYLKETSELANGIQAIAARHPSITPSFNQTFDPPLRTNPITVSIETKKSGIDWEKAIIQISTWAAAQFTRLEQLLYDSGHAGQPLPFLPLFIVQGHDWSFLAATRQPGGLTTIWSKVIVGSTNSALGVYQIVATLRLLAQWSADAFKPWFEEYVLGLTITPTIEGESPSK